MLASTVDHLIINIILFIPLAGAGHTMSPSFPLTTGACGLCTKKKVSNYIGQTHLKLKVRANPIN